MHRLLPLTALLLFGCANGDGGGAAAGSCSSYEVAFQRLTGGSLEAARATLSRIPAIRSVRVVRAGDAVTQDFRQDRATVTVEGDTVRRITCG
ncbi:MAG TPA: I78 family peptidase inhibitor [Roseomonas sp.]|jgi:hypothetical protein